MVFDIDSSPPPLAVRLLTACRPWGTAISVVPALMGALLAVSVGGAPMYWGRMLVTALAVWLAHSAANMFSDVADFRNGLDRTPIPVSGSLVRGWLTERQTFALGCGCLLAGGLLGAGLAAVAGPAPLAVAAAGLALALGYSGLKRVALGDLAVFVAFGPLIALGAWTVFTGRFSWIPLLWMSPFGLVVIAVLHANNWRDATSDRARGVISVAGLLGDRGSLAYYGALIFGPFLLTLALIELPRRLSVAGWIPMPRAFLLVFLCLPAALSLWRRALRRRTPRDPMEFVTLDGATAKFLVPMGALHIAAAVLAQVMK